VFLFELKKNVYWSFFISIAHYWFCNGNLTRKWDGAGVVLKRWLRHEQLHNPEKRLQYVAKVVSFPEEVLSSRVPTFYLQSRPKTFQKFLHITIDDIDRSNPHGCDSILGCSKFHSIYSIPAIDPTLSMVWDLAWFCPPFVEEWEACQNKFHVF